MTTEKTRIDKWLWAVRIFKSRTIATDFTRTGKIRVGGREVKPSFQIGEGDEITVKKLGFSFQFRVLRLIDRRVGAPIAITCYEDITPEAEKQKYAAWFSAASGRNEIREQGAGRPTKKERRDIDDFKDFEGYDFDED